MNIPKDLNINNIVIGVRGRFGSYSENPDRVYIGNHDTDGTINVNEIPKVIEKLKEIELFLNEKP